MLSTINPSINSSRSNILKKRSIQVKRNFIEKKLRISLENQRTASFPIDEAEKLVVEENVKRD